MWTVISYVWTTGYDLLVWIFTTLWDVITYVWDLFVLVMKFMW